MRLAGTKDLSLEKKAQIAQWLILHSIDGIIAHGAIQNAADHFQISRRSVQRIWAESKKHLSEGTAIAFQSNRKCEHRKPKTELKKENLANIPVKKRSSYRKIGKQIGVSKSLVCTWVKEKQIRAHTNAIKTDLTATHKLLRLHFCLASLQFHRASNKIMFKGMHNTVHIDEKWFFISKTCDRYYLLPHEEEPHRSYKSKGFITKVMFMAAVSRPVYSESGEVLFEGRIDIFPFTKYVPAKRNNKNRVRGTLETKPIEAVTKEVIKECILKQVVPAIKAKWPASSSEDIFIQQDNAKPHIQNDDIEFRDAATNDGFNIQLICQPANSPDTNINDLGFFRAIQSLQEDTASNNMDELVKDVIEAYYAMTHTTLNNVFLSLQGCMIDIMKCKVHNTYEIPHLNKQRLIRQGQLPKNLEEEVPLVEEVIKYLNEPGNEVEHMYEVETLKSDLDY